MKDLSQYNSSYYQRNKNKILSARKEYYQQNKQAVNEQRIRRKYLISTGNLKSLWEFQNKSCALCDKQLILFDKYTHIDHCHTSGKVRGILCSRCNTALGALGDSIERLEKVVTYLKENEKKVEELIRACN